MKRSWGVFAAATLVLAACVAGPEWGSERTYGQLTVYKSGLYTHQGERKVCYERFDPGMMVDCSVYHWDYRLRVWVTDEPKPQYGLPIKLRPQEIGWPTTRELGEDPDPDPSPSHGQP